MKIIILIYLCFVSIVYASVKDWADQQGFVICKNETLVTYKDYAGNIQQGILNNPALYQESIEDLLLELQSYDFRFAHIKKINTIEQALTDNISFFLCKQEQFLFMVNPASNPIIFTYGKNIAIQPFSGIFSINHRADYTNAKIGRIDKKIALIFAKYHLYRYLGDRENYLFLGTFSNVPQDRKENQFINFIAPVFNPENFYFMPLSDAIKIALKEREMWKVDCPVALERLSYVVVDYIGFDNKVHSGNLIVADILAEEILVLFKYFYNSYFPLEPVVAMSDPNNSEATVVFNCRNIVGGGKISAHSYGTAIDINMLRNPYLGLYEKLDNNIAKGQLIPNNSKLDYVFRSTEQLGYVESIKNVMYKHGFTTWGGNWTIPVDYMHFQIASFVTKMYPLVDKETGKILFQLAKTYPQIINKLSDVSLWLYLYQTYPETFVQALITQFHKLDTLSEKEFFFLIHQILQ